MKKSFIKRGIAAVAALFMVAAGLCLPLTANATEEEANEQLAAYSEPANGGLTDDDLIGAYDFEDENNKGKDSSGHDNTMILHGDLEYGKPGDYGSKVIQLRGGNGQYLEFPQGMFDNKDNFTLEFASKSRMGDSDNFFTFSLGDTTQKYFYSRLRPSSVYTAITKSSYSAEQSVMINNVSTSNAWHQYRISVSPTMIAVFIDGQLKGINRNVDTSVTDLGTNLTATFGKSTYSGDKYYNGGIDDVKVYDATYISGDMVWDGVTLPGGTETNLTLPTADALDNPITWTSSDTTILGNDGTLVAQPAVNTDVTMTATVTINGQQYAKTFTVAVTAAITTAEQAAQRLLLDYEQTDGATLPTSITGVDGANVTWTSNPAGNLNDGKIVGADGDSATEATLTATIELGGTTTTKTFTDIKIMPKNAQTIASYTRDGSVNGGTRVGNALHLALNQDGESFEALNQNYGVAFAEANYVVNEANSTINTTGPDIGRGIADPYLFRMKDGKYAFVAVLTKYDTTKNQDSATEQRTDPGEILFLTSDNLYQWSDAPNDYEVTGRIKVTDDTTAFDNGSLSAGYDASAGNYRIGWSTNGVARYVTTEDFVTFSEVHLNPAFAKTTPDLTGIDNAQASNAIPIEQSDALKLAERLGRVTNTHIENPEQISVDKDVTKDELLKQVTGADSQGTPVIGEDGTYSKGATSKATYSDGSTFDFRVNWDQDELNAIDTSADGDYTIHGTINQQNYSEQFPMMGNRADPNIVFWKGKYYAMGTSDSGGMTTLYIRSSETLAGLKDAKQGSNVDGGWKVDGQDTYLFGPNDKFGHGGYHWAPELHVIDGTLYCYLATYPTGHEGDAQLSGAPNWAGPSAYVYQLTGEDQDPTKTDNWTEHRVQNKNGSELNLKALTIDMTYFEVNGQSYVAWSQGDDTYAGARAGLYIAKTTKEKPWQITSDPVRLAQPVYGWELSGVSEGPNVLVSGGNVYMVFSAQEVGPQYATGMIIADKTADLTDADSWTKSNYPWLKNGTFANQQGLGHNSYFTDPYGDTYNVYHALLNGTGSRHAGILPVHFRADGTPIIDMTTSEELDQSKKDVTLEIRVGEGGQVDPTPSIEEPTLHYSFDAEPTDSITVMNEGSAQDSDATINGTGTTFENGHVILDGNANISVPTSAISAQQNVTVSMWLKNNSGNGNTAAAYIGSAKTAGSSYPTKGYWLLNPANPGGYVKSVMTSATADNSNGQPYNTEVGPGRTGNGAEGNTTTPDGMALYTAVINGEQGTMAVYVNDSKIGDYTVPVGGLTSYGDLVAFIGASAYDDPNSKLEIADYAVYASALSTAQVKQVYTQGLLDRAIEDFDPGLSATDHDFQLPLTVGDSVAVTWSVKDGSHGLIVDGDTAKVTRSDDDQQATLIATLSLDGENLTREYPIRVIGNGGALATYPRGTDTASLENSRTQAVNIALADTLEGSYTTKNNGRPVLYPDYDNKQNARMSTVVTFRMADGSFGIIGGDSNSPSSWIWFYTTKDFLKFDRSVDKYGTGLTGSVLPIEVSYDNLTKLYTMIYKARSASDDTYYKATTADFQPGSWSQGELVRDYQPTSFSGTGLQSDAMNPHAITISSSEKKALELRYSRIVNTTLDLDSASTSLKTSEATSAADLLKDVRATAQYSDGSTKSFKVDWNEDSLNGVNLDEAGTYTVTGTVNQPTYNSPLVRERADPDATYVEETGEYYLTGSYPMCNNNDPEGYDRIVLRHATTLNGLTTSADTDPDYNGHTGQMADNETIIWDEANQPEAGRYVWAPELEKIGDTYYVLFTASTSKTNVWGIRPMMLKFTGDLAAGDSLTDSSKWQYLGQVKAAAGDNVAFHNFSLDMTHFNADGKDYLVWAEKPGNTSTIRLAQIDQADPTQLISQSVMVTTPEMVWERKDQNGNDVLVNEGPSVLKHDGKVYLFFSNAAVDKSYCISYLTIDEDGDILNPSAWYKNTYPVLGADDFDDRMGTGHNSFTIDENGNPVIVYHARLNSEPIDASGGDLVNGGLFDPRRHAFAKTVHFAADGSVVLNQTADEEITSQNRAKELTFQITVTDDEEPAPDAPDVSALQTLIHRAEGLSASDYTTDSWNVMQAKLAAARTALNSTDQQEVDEATAALSSAIDGLVLVATPEPGEVVRIGEETPGYSFLRQSVERGREFTFQEPDVVQGYLSRAVTAQPSAGSVRLASVHYTAEADQPAGEYPFTVSYLMPDDVVYEVTYTPMLAAADTGGESGNDTQPDDEPSDTTADQSNTAADSESADTSTGGLPSTGDTVMGLSALAVLLAIAGISLLAWHKRQA